MSNNQQYVVMRSPKSLGIGLILTFFFGPIGLFYATISGAIIMLIIDAIFAVIGFLTLGYSLIVTAPLVNLVCMVWAYVRISSYNKALMAGAMRI
jgi:hypothetical protein